MTRFEAAGLFLGIIAGAVFGAMLCSAHGTLAYVGGAVAGGFVGMIVGTLLGHLSMYVYAFVRAVAQAYWEVLTGRRKLPSMSSTTESHRRRVLLLIAAILVVAAVIWTCIYLAASDARRSLVLGLAALSFGVGFIGMLVLMFLYRRYPAQKEGRTNE